MKKVLCFLFSMIALFACEKYDDSKLWNAIDSHDKRISQLELLCSQMNTNIVSLQTLVNALQNNDYVTNVAPIMSEGKEIGYTISFSKSGSITIYHGVDGKSASAPVIALSQDDDGDWYWTLDGTWLTDANGNKIRANGHDGGVGNTPQFKILNGQWLVSYDNGVNWQNIGQATGNSGSDGVTPLFKVEDGDWYVSYDKGSSWQRLGQATGNSGGNGITPQFKIEEGNWYISYDGGTSWKMLGQATGTSGGNGITPLFKIDDCFWYVSYDGGTSWQKLGQATGNAGNNGVTPQFKIEEGYWYISYDNKETWTKLGQATGDRGGQGLPGADGSDGDSIFKSVTQDDNNVYFNLSDGTTLIIRKNKQDGTDPIQFADINVLIVCLDNWDTNADGMLSYDEAAAVTSLGDAFKGNTEIKLFTEFIFFTGVTKLDGEEFSGCSSLRYISLPPSLQLIQGLYFDGVKYVFKGPFKDCSSLNSVLIPSSVETIGSASFNGCSALKTVTFEAGSKLSLVDTCSFYNCIALQSISIPSSVSMISGGAFEGCTNLETLNFSDDSMLSEIGGFKSYLSPQEVNITYFRRQEKFYGAFRGCTSLKSVIIPKSVKTIGIGAFAECEALSDVRFETGSQVECILGSTYYKTYFNASNTSGRSYGPAGAFTGCTSLSSFSIPATVKVLGGCCFNGCTSLAEVVFENGSILSEISAGGYTGSTSYGYEYCGAFNNTVITEVYLPGSVSIIGNCAFANVSSLKYVHIASTMPPTFGEFVLQSSNSAYFVVPSSSLSNYKTLYPGYSKKFIGE